MLAVGSVTVATKIVTATPERGRVGKSRQVPPKTFECIDPEVWLERQVEHHFFKYADHGVEFIVDKRDAEGIPLSGELICTETYNTIARIDITTKETT